MVLEASCPESAALQTVCATSDDLELPNCKRPRLDPVEASASSASSSGSSSSSSSSVDARNSPIFRLVVEGVGAINVAMDPVNAPRTVATLAVLARWGARGRVHRAEAVGGGDGPPYGLVQATLDDPSKMLKALRHEGAKPIMRGSVCLIGGTSDVFVSLAPHPGWERSMTVFGKVSEPASTAAVGAILAKPIHQSKHPKHGTLMAMLDTKLGLHLEESGVSAELMDAIAFEADADESSEWQVHFSKGRPYYHNKATKATQWTKPS